MLQEQGINTIKACSWHAGHWENQTFTFSCLLPCRALADAKFPQFLPKTSNSHHLHLRPVVPLLSSALAQSTSKEKPKQKNRKVFLVIWFFLPCLTQTATQRWYNMGEGRRSEVSWQQWAVNPPRQSIEMETLAPSAPTFTVTVFPTSSAAQPLVLSACRCFGIKLSAALKRGWLTQGLTDRLLPAFPGLASHPWQQGCWKPPPEPEFAGHNTKRAAAAAAAPARQTWLRIASAE